MRTLLFFLCSFSSVVVFSEDNDLFRNKELFLDTYQDVLVHNQVLRQGSEICDVRFNLIKPILYTYKRPFTVLDIGAAEGYFSFKTAEEFPNSIVVALEGGSGRGYYQAGLERLKVLTELNSHLNNFVCLQHRLTFDSLQALRKKEHFDVVVKVFEYTNHDEEFSQVEYDARGNVKYSSMIVKLCSYSHRTEFILNIIKREMEENPRQQMMVIAHNKSILKYIKFGGNPFNSIVSS